MKETPALSNRKLHPRGATHAERQHSDGTKIISPRFGAKAVGVTMQHTLAGLPPQGTLAHVSSVSNLTQTSLSAVDAEAQLFPLRTGRTGCLSEGAAQRLREHVKHVRFVGDNDDK